MAPLQFLSLHLKIGFCLPESLIPLFQYWLLRSSQQGPPHFGHTTVVVLMVLCSWCCGRRSSYIQCLVMSICLASSKPDKDTLTIRAYRPAPNAGYDNVFVTPTLRASTIPAY